jgi:hypothetical protein
MSETVETEYMLKIGYCHACKVLFHIKYTLLFLSHSERYHPTCFLPCFKFGPQSFFQPLVPETMNETMPVWEWCISSSIVVKLPDSSVHSLEYFYRTVDIYFIEIF